MLQVEILPVLDDNYIFVLHDAASGATAVVDPAEAEPVLAFLQRKGWRLDYVLNTHHHWDHVGGNLELHGATGCRIAGARADKDRIPGLDTFLAEGDRLALGDNVIEVLEVPGHTRAHLAYWLPQAKRLFCGDTLFGLGCGRLFEGSAEQMWRRCKNWPHCPGKPWSIVRTSTPRPTAVSPGRWNRATALWRSGCAASRSCATGTSQPCLPRWPRRSRPIRSFVPPARKSAQRSAWSGRRICRCSLLCVAARTASRRNRPRVGKSRGALKFGDRGPYP